MPPLATREEYEQPRRDTPDCPFNGADERPTAKPHTPAALPAQERLKVTLVSAAKQNSPEATVQFAFSVPMDKKSIIAEWIVPLLVWFGLLGIFVSLVVALFQPAGW